MDDAARMQNYQTLDDILLLFDRDYPCWTTEMFSFAGYDVALPLRLTEIGLLDSANGTFRLTATGAKRFQKIADALFLPVKAAFPISDFSAHTSDACFLKMLLDKKHSQRWGMKEFLLPFLFKIPALPDEEIFQLVGDELTWLYQDSDPFLSMQRDFPLTGIAARGAEPELADRLDGWLAARCPVRVVQADLMYKSRYDFREYIDFKPLASDPCALLNTDRFLFFFAPPPTLDNLHYFLRTAGEFQMFMTMLRRMYLPGYTDRDGLDQDTANWLLFAYQNEEDAKQCLELLAPFAAALTGPAAPFEIWVQSTQALVEHREMAESIHDLLPLTARALCRII